MRRGSTRSHPEHGRDTRQRRWYCLTGGSVGPRLLVVCHGPLRPPRKGPFLLVYTLKTCLIVFTMEFNSVYLQIEKRVQ